MGKRSWERGYEKEVMGKSSRERGRGKEVVGQRSWERGYGIEVMGKRSWERGHGKKVMGSLNYYCSLVVIFLIIVTMTIFVLCSLRMAKSVMRIILNMLNHQYYINVILSTSRVYDAKGAIVQPEAVARVLTCNENSLVPATEHNLQELHVAIHNIEASGGSDHLWVFSGGVTGV